MSICAYSAEPENEIYISSDPDSIYQSTTYYIGAQSYQKLALSNGVVVSITIRLMIKI